MFSGISFQSDRPDQCVKPEKKGNAMSNDKELGTMIRAARENLKYDVDFVRTKVDASVQWIYEIENGKRIPSLELLIKIFLLFNENKNGEYGDLLEQWLLKWVIAYVDANKEINKLDGQREAIRSNIDRLLSKSTKHSSIRSTGSTTLENFPDAFYPLTIICGDRRETTPRNKADIFAYSVSTIDLMYILKLGLERTTKIKSDKIFALMDDDYLQAELGNTNLLIIGSPAANFAARRINKDSLFRFGIPKEMQTFEKKLGDLKQLNDEAHLQVFWKMIQEPENKDISKYEGGSVPKKELIGLRKAVEDLLQRYPLKYLLNQYKKPGLIDPADGMVHAQHTGLQNDFGLVSLAKHPFSEKHLCVFVGGIHGPGTANALATLSDGRNFKNHPMGGIIEVNLSVFSNWPSKFEKATWEWQTSNYDADGMRSKLTDILVPKQSTEDSMNLGLPRDEAQNCLEIFDYLSNYPR
jgi:DNA-binding XRE family transcriptional regulator